MNLVVLPAPGWPFLVLPSRFPFFSPLLSSVPQSFHPCLHPSLESSSTPLYLSPSLPPSLHPSLNLFIHHPLPSLPGPSLHSSISPSIHLCIDSSISGSPFIYLFIHPPVPSSLLPLCARYHSMYCEYKSPQTKLPAVIGIHILLGRDPPYPR